LLQRRHHPEYAGHDFLVSGVENLTGKDLAKKFSIGLGETIEYYAMPPRQFGQILDSLYGPGAGKGAEEMYQSIADTRQYPMMYAPNLEDVLKKLPVQMTPIESWVRDFRAVFQPKALA
jgi:hypothetical protein